MFIEERHREILKLLDEVGSINTALIQRKFMISYDSAKRDLRILEEKGLLKRTHGGAVSLKQAQYGYNIPKPTSAPIAEYAASLISDGDFVFLDASAEGIELARVVSNSRSFGVATNSPAAAEILRSKISGKVIVTGGEIDRTGGCFDGFSAEMLKKLRFDKCFISTDGISAKFGISVKDNSHIQFYSALMGSSRKIIGMYPKAKIGNDSLFSVCSADKLDCMICENADGDEVNALSDVGVYVVGCESGE